MPDDSAASDGFASRYGWGSERLPATKKKPRTMPGLRDVSFGERSVLRHDRTAPAELVVQADANRIELVVEAICGAREREVDGIEHGHIVAAEVDVKIFTLDG